MDTSLAFSGRCARRVKGATGLVLTIGLGLFVVWLFVLAFPLAAAGAGLLVLVPPTMGVTVAVTYVLSWRHNRSMMRASLLTWTVLAGIVVPILVIYVLATVSLSVALWAALGLLILLALAAFLFERTDDEVGL